MDYFAYFHKFEMALFSRQKVIRFVPGVSLYIPCNLFWKLNILVLHFYSSCLSLCKVTQDFYDFGNNRVFLKNKMIALQNIKLEDIILELKDGKDFNAILLLGEKSFQIHLGMCLAIVVRVVNLSGK